jgi:diaminohydroxyphosphoribosylaminopyrimidine deaminase/5-amino-6-(5-phosphoribosylamino)uracil reductase
MVDPNPRVAGCGLGELQSAGIRIVVGEHEAAARRLNEVFVTYITRRRPFVIVKYAMSLDGKIATPSGASRGLTGQAWQHELHVLRRQMDAILVGVNTVLADDPLLTARLAGDNVRQPLRVVLDSTLRSPLTARMLADTTPGVTMVVTTGRHDPQKAAALRDLGAQVIVLGDTRVDVRALVAMLGEHEVSSLLVEGGGEVIASFVEAGLVDKVIAVIAPVLIGGRTAPTPVAGAGVDDLAQALRLRDVELRRVGDDIVLTGYLCLAAKG